MSSDGAHIGVDAERALATILGGESAPTEEECMSATEMRAWILAARPEDRMTTYGECARWTAKLTLLWLLQHPSDEDPYDAMKAAGHDLGALGLTGFQWGWALNAARRCVELPPLPNPAIMDLG